MLEYSHQTYKLTGHSTLADLVCLHHTTQKWQEIKSTLLNSRKTTNLPSLPHMRISLSLWQQSFQSLGTSRIKSNIFWFQLVVLSASCLFLSFVFSARKKKYSSKTKSTAKKTNLFQWKKTITQPKKRQLIGLHRKTTPQDPSPILSNFWYFSREFALKFWKDNPSRKDFLEKLRNLRFLPLAYQRQEHPLVFEPKHCKRWNTEVIKFPSEKKKRTRKKAVYCSMTENPLCIHTWHKSCRSIHFCPRVRFCVNLQGPQSHKACQQILSCGSGSSGCPNWWNIHSGCLAYDLIFLAPSMAQFLHILRLSQWMHRQEGG